MTKDEMLAAIESGWTRLRSSAKQLGLDSQTPSGWTVAEMLTHVAFWEETCVPMAAHFRGLARPAVEAWYGGDDLGVGPNDSWPRADVHNAREASWARARSANDVLARCESAHQGLLALVRGLGAEEPAGQRLQELIASESYGHYPEHQAELDALAGGAGPGES